MLWKRSNLVLISETCVHKNAHLKQSRTRHSIKKKKVGCGCVCAHGHWFQRKTSIPTGKNCPFLKNEVPQMGNYMGVNGVESVECKRTPSNGHTYPFKGQNFPFMGSVWRRKVKIRELSQKSCLLFFLKSKNDARKIPCHGNLIFECRNTLIFSPVLSNALTRAAVSQRWSYQYVAGPS